MSAVHPRRQAQPRHPGEPKRLLIALGLLLAWSVRAWCGEPVYPACLMNWMVEGTSHALIVEKSRQRLSVWKIANGEPSMIEWYPCSTGKNVGDKWVRGDMRTPDGVYLFCSLISGNSLPPKYGPWAFTTDYPNFVDQRRGKGGDGIWLHGRDKPLGPAPDSNGCIALENSDLLRVSKFIRLQSTPLIIVNKMRMAPRFRIMEQERELRDFIESWRQAWESQDLARYMRHYSRNFQSCRLDYRGWKEKKRSLNKRYDEIRVRLGNVNLYRQGDVVTAIGEQTYTSDRFRAEGIKILYITRDGAYRVYSEDYREPVDDPVPVKPLLARVGREVGRGAHEQPEFRIRLVSTDGRDLRPRDDIEIPRPVAPSRGVMLQRIAAGRQESSPVPVLVTNKKRPGRGRHERLVVVQALAPSPPLFETAVLRRLERNPVTRVSADSFAIRNAWDKASFATFRQNRKSSSEEKDLNSEMRLHQPVFPGGTVSRNDFGTSSKASFNPDRAVRVETHQ